MRVRVRVRLKGCVTAQQVRSDSRCDERRQDVKRQHAHVSPQGQPESITHLHVKLTLKHLVWIQSNTQKNVILIFVFVHIYNLNQAKISM